MANKSDSIANSSHECLDLLKILVGNQHFQPRSRRALEDGLGRFKLWAGNLGALHTGPSSLDTRLGDSRLRREILSLLAELLESLRYLETPEEPSQEDETPPLDPAELEEIQDDLVETTDGTITNLLKLAPLVRHNPGRDPWKRIFALPPWDPRPMIDNVHQKWPKLRTNADLSQRLGVANSRRRQFFRYREEHVAKLALPLNDNGTVTETTPTTFLDVDGIVNVQPPTANSNDDAMSDTTFATTFGQDADTFMTIPEPPEGYDKKSVECPLCRTIVTVKTKRAWKKHVYRDLRPYVCTFEDCEFKVFDKRRDWIQHELDEHRAYFDCHTCGKTFLGKRSLKDHMHNSHGVADPTQDVIAIAAHTENRIVYTASMCPFCDDWNSEMTRRMGTLPQSEFRFLNGSPIVSIKQLCKHMGRHMEQSALFSLPRTNEEDGEASRKVDDPDLKQEDSDDPSGDSESSSGHSEETERDRQQVEHADKNFEENSPQLRLSPPSTDEAEIAKEHELLDSSVSSSLLPSPKHLEQENEEPMNDIEQGPESFERDQEEFKRSKDTFHHSDERLELTSEDVSKSTANLNRYVTMPQQPVSEPHEAEAQRRNIHNRSEETKSRQEMIRRARWAEEAAQRRKKEEKARMLAEARTEEDENRRRRKENTERILRLMERERDEDKREDRELEKEFRRQLETKMQEEMAKKEKQDAEYLERVQNDATQFGLTLKQAEEMVKGDENVRRRKKEERERIMREIEQEEEDQKRRYREEEEEYKRRLEIKKQEEKAKKEKQDAKYLERVQKDFTKFSMTPNQVKGLVEEEESQSRWP